MHGSGVTLAGPVWWFAVALFISTWLLMGFVAIDIFGARRQERLSAVPESRWIYFVPAVTYFILAIAIQFLGLQALAAGVILASPLLLILGLVYLLRIVFVRHHVY